MDTFPKLAGLEWNIEKDPTFANLVQQSVSGREVRASEMVYPLYQFSLSWSILRDDPSSQTPSSPFDELKKLMGFFLKQNGRFHAFLYQDDSDYTCTDLGFGVGDGATTQFQLTRTYGVSYTFVDPVNNVNAITNVKENGVIIPAGSGAGKYTINSTGLITFGTAPTAGHALTWTGTYYYKVRFMDDASNWKWFMANLWENKKLAFIGSTYNKV